MCIFMYLCLYVRQYKWPSGPSVVDFKYINKYCYNTKVNVIIHIHIIVGSYVYT